MTIMIFFLYFVFFFFFLIFLIFFFNFIFETSTIQLFDLNKSRNVRRFILFKKKIPIYFETSFFILKSNCNLFIN